MTKSYSEIKVLVRKAITGGRYKANDRLPTDQELATHYRTSRLTVHRALRELANEGLVCRGPSRGTRVSDPAKHIVGTVAVLLPEPLSPRGWGWMTPLGEDLLESGIALVPYLCPNVSRGVQIANLLVRHPVLGVILVPPSHAESVEIIRVFQESNIPVVIEGKYELPGLKVGYVTTNHRQGGRILGEHLISLGHSKMAVISGAHTQDAMERREGFSEAAVRAGCPLAQDLCFEVKHQREIPYLVRDLMKRTGRPTAIFGINDYIALEVMVALHELGVRVPKDCAVVGMGDEPMSKGTLSPLTTARAPLDQEGHMLASVLLNIIRGRLSEPQEILFDYELVVRKSCGAERREKGK